MAIFSYTAKDSQGQTHKGEIETVDEYQAARILRRKRLIVISLRTKEDGQINFLSKFFSKVPFSDVVVTTRQLATMVGAGLVLSEALDILEEQQTNKRFQEVLEAISNDIKGGLDFASALEKYPDVFPGIYSKLVKAGQSSGKLDTVLLELASNLEKEREFRSRVKGAMIYPLVILTMMLAVMMIMVFFVMPRLMTMYKDSGLELPLPTQIVIGLTNFMLSFWWLMIIVVAVIVTSFKKYISTPGGELAFSKILLKAPVAGRVINLVILTNFTRTFALLVASGISILESISIVGQIVGNRYYRDSLEISYKGVERGLTFSSQLLGLQVFPKIVGQMVKTGEETGKLDEIMSRLADYFESEADNSLRNLTTLIEPIVLILLGLGVAFLVVSIILPIYQLTTNIK